MFNLSLTACSFLLKKPYSHHKYYNLNDNIPITKNDNVDNFLVKDMFLEFFYKYSNSIDDKQNKKTFHCLFEDSYQGKTDNYRFLYTIIKSGSYGSSSDIVDTNTKKIVYKLQPEHTVEKPFYLYVVIPKDNKTVKVQKGMFFFQNVGQFGIKTITTDYMKEFFSDKFNITLECKTIAPKLFVDRMLTQDNVLQIMMTKNYSSGDSADNIDVGYGVETHVIGNLVFKQERWNKIKNDILFFAQGKLNLFEFNNIQYQKLKVKANIGGRIRTINMNNIENLSLIEGIPEDIQDIDGHPKKFLLLNYFEKVANEYISEMTLQVT